MFPLLSGPLSPHSPPGLGWREQHARPKVAPWIGHWRTNEKDAGRLILECRFSNRGHDRELVQLFLEFRKAGALIEHTNWKSPMTIHAGSTQITRVPLEVLLRQVGWYTKGANVERLPEVMVEHEGDVRDRRRRLAYGRTRQAQPQTP
jgi:hypothetical protein